MNLWVIFLSIVIEFCGHSIPCSSWEVGKCSNPGERMVVVVGQEEEENILWLRSGAYGERGRVF